jgi:hypothetical protein
MTKYCKVGCPDQNPRGKQLSGLKERVLEKERRRKEEEEEKGGKPRNEQHFERVK